MTQEIQTHWAAISHLFSVRNEEEYDREIGLISSLPDKIGTDERHPLYALLDTLGTLVYEYEEKHHPCPNAAPVRCRNSSWRNTGLPPPTFPISVRKQDVSDIITNKREFTVREIQRMARRFYMSPAVFI